MAAYRHLNTGAFADLIEDKGTTMQMKVAETGELKEIGAATFKRWWKLVPAETEETPDAVSETLKVSDSPAESTEAQNETEPVEPDKTPAEKPDANMETVEPQNEPEEIKPNTGAPLALSDVVKKLEELFNLLNGLYFENKLPRSVITVQSTPKAYGHCSTKKIWRSGVEGEGDAYYEINIGAEYLNRASENTAATMLHEMVHLYCRENELKETCQGVRYHNNLFKDEAESRDLEIEYSRAAGYSTTKPTEDLIEKLRAAGYVLEIPFARYTPEKEKKSSDRAKAHRYFCAVCGQEVRSTADLKLICGICEIPMEVERAG